MTPTRAGALRSITEAVSMMTRREATGAQFVTFAQTVGYPRA